MSRPGTILILGANGFLGSHLAAGLSAAGSEVIPATRDGRCGGFAFDLLDPASIIEVLRQVRPDAVVNAAGLAGIRRSWRDPARAFEANVAGVENLLRAFERVDLDARLLLLSSGAVYASPDDPAAAAGPRTEESPLGPSSPYGASKAAMEAISGARARFSGLPVTIVRAFNLIGAGQAPRSVPRCFAEPIAEAERRGLDRVGLEVGNPDSTRDFTDVRDAARACAALLEREAAGTFNLCSGVPTGIGEIIDALARLTPIEVEVRPQPSLKRPVDDPSLTGSPRKLIDACGWRPAIGLEESLAGMLDDLRHAGRSRPRRPGYC